MCIVTKLNVVKVPRSDTQPKGYIAQKDLFFSASSLLVFLRCSSPAHLVSVTGNPDAKKQPRGEKNKLKPETAVLKMCAGQGNKQHPPAGGELGCELSPTCCFQVPEATGSFVILVREVVTAIDTSQRFLFC